MNPFRPLQWWWLSLCVLLPIRSGLATPVKSTPPPRADPEPGIGTPREAPTADAATLLMRYQAALDQIALGHLMEARELREEYNRKDDFQEEYTQEDNLWEDDFEEDDFHGYEDDPGLNPPIAYLSEREGRGDRTKGRGDRTSRQLPSAAVQSDVATAFAVPALNAPAPRALARPALALPALAAHVPILVPQPDVRLVRLEQAMARLVNAERARLGLPTLIHDSRLAAAARAHSAEMRDRRYFAHESPTAALRHPLDRYRAVFQATPAIVAENLFRAWGGRRQLSEAEVQRAHADLMRSPGHYSNIVQARVTHIGIGILANANGDIWITQMFSKPQ